MRWHVQFGAALLVLFWVFCAGCRFLPPRNDSKYADLSALLVGERGELSRTDALEVDRLFEQAAREKELHTGEISFLCSVVDRVKGKSNEETYLSVVGTALGGLRYLPKEARPDVARITQQMEIYSKRHGLTSTLHVTAQRLQSKLRP